MTTKPLLKSPMRPPTAGTQNGNRRAIKNKNWKKNESISSRAISGVLRISCRQYVSRTTKHVRKSVSVSRNVKSTRSFKLLSRPREQDKKSQVVPDRRNSYK